MGFPRPYVPSHIVLMCSVLYHPTLNRTSRNAQSHIVLNNSALLYSPILNRTTVRRTALLYLTVPKREHKSYPRRTV